MKEAGSFIHADNLKSALFLAIKKLEDQDMGHCIAADAYRANLKYLEEHGNLTVIPE